MEDDSKEDDEEEVVNYGNAPSPPVKRKLPSFENLDESLLTGPSVIKG